jgi:tetratricopeptide (TPR) repeat protein
MKNTDLFDAIVWLSAKEDQLTYTGIEELEPSLKNYENLLKTILEVMGYGSIEDHSLEECEKDVETIFEIHDKILLIIDNFETVKDTRIVDFILDSPKNCNILVTSRRGIGQVERRYELQQLREQEAIFLFRQIAKDKGLIDLAKLSTEIIKNYVNKVSCYPLAIKWVIGKASLGHNIRELTDEITSSTSDISLFCFDHIFNSLTEKSRLVLFTLSTFEETPSSGIVKYISDLSAEAFSDSIYELILVSLIIPEQFSDANGEIETKFSLLPLTKGYVRKQLDNDTITKRNIDERYRSVQVTVEEANRAKKKYRFSLQNLGATTEEEKVASMLVQTAFQKYQSGRYGDAVHDYERASEIAPNFSSIYRNWAVMESNESHNALANKLMEKAAKLSPEDPQIWLTWGNMSRRIDRIEDALKYYQKAMKLTPNDCVILNALGQVKCRQGNHSDAHILFMKALEMDSAGCSIRHEIINKSSIADNLLRWAENLNKDKNFSLAEEKYLEAIQFAEDAFELDPNDEKTAKKLRQIQLNTGIFFRERSNNNLAVKYLIKASSGEPNKYQEARLFLQAKIEMALMLEKHSLSKRISETLSPYVINLAKRIHSGMYRKITDILSNTELESTRIKGKVIRVNNERSFVIIESDISRGETFLGLKSSFCDFYDSLLDILGETVSFIPKIDKYRNEEKQVAINIKILSEINE